MMEIGLMTKQMASVSICISMAPGMKVHGKTTYSMEKAKRLGQMGLFMKENTDKGKNMVTVTIRGVMAPDMKENGSRIRLEDWEYTLGWMVENT